MPTEPYNLYGGTPPHEATDTSRAAALMAKSRAATVRANILRTISLAGGYGKTDDEIETLLGLRHQSASARRRELVLLGLLRDSGNRRLTRGKRYATVWVAT